MAMETEQRVDGSVDRSVVPIKSRTHALITYILFAAGLFIPFLNIVGVIMAYIQRGEAAGSVYESHFQWLITAFWWSFALGIVGSILAFTGIGAIIGIPLLLGTWIFYLYRVIKGGVRVLDGRPVP